MITENNLIKLLDFGESKNLADSSDILEITKTGTLVYMAPELRKLKLNIPEQPDETAMIDGCKADIYSLGITMLSLIYPREKTQIKLL